MEKFTCEKCNTDYFVDTENEGFCPECNIDADALPLIDENDEIPTSVLEEIDNGRVENDDDDKKNDERGENDGDK